MKLQPDFMARSRRHITLSESLDISVFSAKISNSLCIEFFLGALLMKRCCHDTIQSICVIDCRPYCQCEPPKNMLMAATIIVRPIVVSFQTLLIYTREGWPRRSLSLVSTSHLQCALRLSAYLTRNLNNNLDT